MKKNAFILLSFVALLTSCQTTYYQVYDVQSLDAKQDGSVLVYENADCKLTYNLWSEGGNMNFLLTNKTSNNLYLVMPMSFFVLNGIANDYYTDSSYSLSITNSIAAANASQVSVSGYLINSLAWYPSTISRQISTSAGTSNTKTATTREMAYVCIPPKSSKFIRGFNLSDYLYKDCENYKANYPSKTSPKVTFIESNSPLVFKNRIAYTFDEKSDDIKYIDNNFYVKSLQNYSERAALEKKSEKICGTSLMAKKKYLKMSAPDRFYNTYNEPRQ